MNLSLTGIADVRHRQPVFAGASHKVLPPELILMYH